jgi:mono/diheme cytochrome c family protein
MNVQKGRIFAAASLAALSTLGLLRVVGSNGSDDADSQKGALKSGAQLWAENCITCHEVKPRSSFSPQKSDAIKRHMREEADLSPEEQEAILEFLKSGN